MQAEIFLKVYCPDCDSVNWLLASEELQDYVLDELGGFKCWKCRRSFVLGDDRALDEDEEDADLYDTGRKKPE